MSIGVAAGVIATALYTRLNVASVTAHAGVYEEPAENLAFPYVLVGEAIESKDNRLGGKVGRELIFQIEIWTDERTFDKIHTIAGEIDELLDNYITFAPTGYTTQSLDFEELQLVKVGLLRQGIARYRWTGIET